MLMRSALRVVIVLGLLTREMGPIRCPETSVNNYHTTPRIIPEERRSQFNDLLMLSHALGGILATLFTKFYDESSNPQSINDISLLQPTFSGTWRPLRCMKFLRARIQPIILSLFPILQVTVEIYEACPI